MQIPNDLADANYLLSCPCRTVSSPQLQREMCQWAQGVQDDLHGQGTDPSTAVLGSTQICQRQPLPTTDPGVNNRVFYGGVREGGKIDSDEKIKINSTL